MWRRVHSPRHLHSRGIAAMTLNPSGGPPYGGRLNGSKTVVADDRVVFMALGTFFGLIFLLFGIQIYVRCVWRRLQTSVDEMEDDESEEAPRADIYIREVGRRRNWRRRLNHYFDERSDSSSPAQHIPVGLEKSVLELLPIFVFNTDPAAFSDEMAREVVCAVCLEEFQDGERARLLPKCSHCFHAQCIDMWFLSHSSCPLCRCQVSAPSREAMCDPLLRNSRSCPDFSQMSPDPSEQQLEPWQGPSSSIVMGFSELSLPEESHAASFSVEGDIVSHASTSANVSDESASIVGVHAANDALYLERGSSLSTRAAAMVLEMSDESIRIIEEDLREDQQMNGSQQQASAVEVVITPDIPSPESALSNSSGSTPFVAYQPELPASTSAFGGAGLLEEDTARGSPHHSRKRSFLAVEIIGECELDASGASSEVDTSPVLQAGGL